MVAQLAQEVYNSDLLQMLIPRMVKIDFEVCPVYRGSLWPGRSRPLTPSASPPPAPRPGPDTRFVHVRCAAPLEPEGHGPHFRQPAPAPDRHAVADGRLPLLARPDPERPHSRLRQPGRGAQRGHHAARVCQARVAHKDPPQLGGLLPLLRLRRGQHLRRRVRRVQHVSRTAAPGIGEPRPDNSGLPRLTHRRGCDGRLHTLASPPPLSHTQELLTKHKALAAEVLEANYDKVCAAR